MNRKRFYRNEPKEMRARFDSTCPETGKKIKAGDLCLYLPADKKAYHVGSITAYNYRLLADDQGRL